MSATAWVDGKLVNYQEAKLDLAGWPLGSGIFETIKTVDSQPWALSRHMRRALNSARRNSQLFPAEDLIRAAVSQTVSANPFPTGRLRLLFGADGSFKVTHQEYVELSTAAKLKVRTYLGVHSGIVEKRYPYDRNLELLGEARQDGFDDFILVNKSGFVSETAVANVVFNFNGKWVTPPLNDGVLPGVMRALLIEKAGVSVRQIPASQLDEIVSGFVISSLKIAQPIGMIDGRILQLSKESEQMRAQFAATALATSVG